MQSTIKDIQRTPAASLTEPLTRAEAKTWCIITHTDDDTLIDRLIKVARTQVENKTRRSLVEYTVVLQVQINGPFTLPWGPVRSITNIERRDGYREDDPDWETLTTADYRLDGSVLSGIRCAVYRITYVVGHTGDAGSYPNPASLKDAVGAQVAFLYENRGDNNNAGKFSEEANALLAGHIDYSHV